MSKENFQLDDVAGLGLSSEDLNDANVLEDLSEELQDTELSGKFRRRASWLRQNRQQVRTVVKWMPTLRASENVLTDVVALNVNTTVYKMFPSTPVNSSRSNYERNPFPAPKTLVKSISIRLARAAALTGDQIQTLEDAIVVIKRATSEIAKFPLAKAMGINIKTSDAATESHYVTFDGKYNFMRALAFAPDQTFSLEIHFASTTNLPITDLYVDLHANQTIKL